MQQTEKYKLNLIESSDPFLPEGLNANTRKVEQVLSQNLGSMRTDLDAVMAGLGSGGKTARIAWGSYTGTGKYGQSNANALTFDFRPMLIIVSLENPEERMAMSIMLRGARSAAAAYTSGGVYLSWRDNGVSWWNDYNSSQQNNGMDSSYIYLAIGYDANA